MSDSSPSKSSSPVTTQVAEKLHKTVDAAASSAGAAEDQLRDQAAQAAVKAREATEYARQRSADMVETVTSYTRENPLMALGLAFAAGVVLASITGRR
ncbi:MAG: hypothetical protein CVV10_02395 [Gammaproteobacteria bacterium HGW-Gammaproteobacteria-14]|nr:MAG: hypothetical protein CVV10_02395 [Gammaproteobacteria bacterium HGW-Gammaproteobacteria-14]